MRLLQDELLAFTDPTPDFGTWLPGVQYWHRYFPSFHHKLDEEHRVELTPFVTNTMDELRFHYGEAYAKSVLTLAHHEDAADFRAQVLARETGGKMAYPKQRDHAAHTLYNYLLGWYVFCHAAAFEDALRPFIRARYDLPAGATADRTVYHEFGTLWSFVSLLHDVGYAFEGGIKPGQPNISPKPVQDAAELVDDFLRRIVEVPPPFAVASLRGELERLTPVRHRPINWATLADVSDSLRYLGDLKGVWTAAVATRTGWTAHAPALPEDAFELWKTHYRGFGQPGMADRFDHLEAAYRYQYEQQLPVAGAKVLDHGVIGGLMLLAHSTLYFRLVVPLVAIPTGHSPDTDALRVHFGLDAVEYAADHWYAGVVWATAAVALHNIQQFETKTWPGVPVQPPPLKLSDDPLAYLGILVDVLQEWDRPKSSRGQFFKGKRPLSSRDCRLGASRGKVLVGFGSEKLAGDVVESLDLALDGWRDLVELR